ncbi:MAG: DUF268 domain-containing protein [Ignavibacteriales bacterium]|nr:DUF268 domain-containing protein [Ignavibacteriales bacterium]
MKKILKKSFLLIENRIRYYFGIRQEYSGIQIPKELLNEYSMNGEVDVEYSFRNDFYSDKTPRVYTKAMVDSLIEDVKNGSINYYGKTGKWLIMALKKYSIKEHNTVVMGSVAPHCESISLAFGAKKCTVIEYNEILSEHPSIITIKPTEYDINKIQFDSAFSISSFEHDGLGRYGDPLDPNADLIMMSKMKIILKQRGIIFLSVPIGKDTFVWNEHRIYGRKRLPLLIEGWKLLDSFGYKDKLLDKPTYFGKDFIQPIFVLQNL